MVNKVQRADSKQLHNLIHSTHINPVNTHFKIMEMLDFQSMVFLDCRGQRTKIQTSRSNTFVIRFMERIVRVVLTAFGLGRKYTLNTLREL